jgi:hypothetical protein
MSIDKTIYYRHVHKYNLFYFTFLVNRVLRLFQQYTSITSIIVKDNPSYNSGHNSKISHCTGFQNSPVVIATTCDMNGRMVGVRVPVVKTFLSSPRCQNHFFGQPIPPMQWALRSLSQGIKRPGYEADHSLRTNAEVNVREILYLPSQTSRPTNILR